MYDEILVPTDGSAAAERAIDHAVDIAETYGARIHAVYVVDAGSYSTLEAGSQVVMEALEDEGEQAVERVRAAAADHGVEVVTDVVAGSAHSSLLQYAEDNGVDLVVMGTHGRRGLNRYLLGSVTERVVRSSAVPVLTVGPEGEE
jgi:nucleotide-binding universal stress UspA family protein